MSRSYWRVSPAFWSDEKVTGAEGGEPWGDDTKMLALYLLTCEHRNVAGLFRLPKGYITEDLGWTPERLAEPFAELLRDGFMEYDGRARLCLIVNALDYQSPENDNQAKATLKLLDELPESRLFARLFEQAKRFAKPFAEALQERFPERYGKPTTTTTAISTATKSAREAREDDDCKGAGEGEREAIAADLVEWCRDSIQGWTPDPGDYRWMEKLLDTYSESQIRMVARSVAEEAERKKLSSARNYLFAALKKTVVGAAPKQELKKERELVAIGALLPKEVKQPDPVDDFAGIDFGEEAVVG